MILFFSGPVLGSCGPSGAHMDRKSKKLYSHIDAHMSYTNGDFTQRSLKKLILLKLPYDKMTSLRNIDFNDKEKHNSWKPKQI